MYTDRDVTSTFGSSQVAYPVGRKYDSYTINSWYRENLKTGVIDVTHQLVKNDSYTTWTKGMNESSKFKETLHQGTYNECAAIVDKIILKEGEWRQIKSDPFNKELVYTLNK